MSPELLAARRELCMELAAQLSRTSGIPVEDILGKNRDPLIVAARHQLWMLLSERGMSSNAIAMVVGYDQSSIRYGVRKANSRRVRVAA